MVQMTEEEAGEFPLSLLPPLLPPKYAKFQESLCGVGVVLVTTSAMVGTTHGNYINCFSSLHHFISQCNV